ncbi:hypothetical protein V8G54_032214 [Vigna mungo]|uniref:Protein YIP n=1 Tax=Vigna mungo TaxID=3915 RepID=A0AAQ3MLJ2_VIGMU
MGKFHDSFSKPISGSDEPQQGGWFRTFTVAAYKPYFDVDTSDVLERIIDSLFPFRGSFNEKTATNPDLYGPFWICTTLIFVAASIGTFVTYIAHKLKSKEWDYDINLVTWSAGLFYGYVTIVPLCLYVILKYFSAPAGLVQLFCLYGYSLFVFIPALCMSIVPLDIFRWVVAGVAGFMSATFVALNLRAHIKSAGERWFLIVAGIFLLQLALAVISNWVAKKCSSLQSIQNLLPSPMTSPLRPSLAERNDLLCLINPTQLGHDMALKKVKLQGLSESTGTQWSDVNFKVSSGVSLAVLDARYVKEEMEYEAWRKGFANETNEGSYAAVNRVVPSSPDPLHNRTDTIGVNLKEQRL